MVFFDPLLADRQINDVWFWPFFLCSILLPIFFFLKPNAVPIFTSYPGLAPKQLRKMKKRHESRADDVLGYGNRVPTTSLALSQSETNMRAYRANTMNSNISDDDFASSSLDGLGISSVKPLTRIQRSARFDEL